jgi:hypothetical protein
VKAPRWLELRDAKAKWELLFIAIVFVAVTLMHCGVLGCARPTASPAPPQPVPAEQLDDPGPEYVDLRDAGVTVEPSGGALLLTGDTWEAGTAVWVGPITPSSTNYRMADSSTTLSFVRPSSAPGLDDGEKLTFHHAPGDPCVQACWDVAMRDHLAAAKAVDGSGHYIPPDVGDALITKGVACVQGCGLVPEVTHGPDWKPPSSVMDDGGGMVIGSQPAAWAKALPPGHVILEAPCNAETKGAKHVTMQKNSDGTVRVWLGQILLGDFSPQLLHGAHVERGGSLVEVLP